MADPIAVKILVVRPSSVLVETGGVGVHFPIYLCRRGELPQDAAKRVLKENYGLRTERVVSLPIITRIAVEDIPASERTSWPKGARTIPCIAFSYTIGENDPVLGRCDWLSRREGNLLAEKADRETFATI